MEKIIATDIRLKYPGFYNTYPISNEVSISGSLEKIPGFDNEELWLDDEYGRQLRGGASSLYGNSHQLPYYNYTQQKYKQFDIVEYLRVPFRKIPIFQFTNIEDLSILFDGIKKENPDYEILLRGQTKIYTVERNKEENLFLYGEEAPKEPSFHPSFLRGNFNEFFIYSLWHSQTAMLLHDVGIDLKSRLNMQQYQAYKDDVFKIKNSSHFTPVSLGFAQHYGLPSVGLDLTDDVKVATWFASHYLPIDDRGLSAPAPISDFSQSTIFFLKCPADTVFSYEKIKPKFLTDTRPDRQKAWFGHCGWGFAKNQLASYIICGIRVDSRILNLFNKDYPKSLFPNRQDDLVLDFFLNIKENSRNQGEVERALKKVYYLD